MIINKVYLRVNVFALVRRGLNWYRLKPNGPVVGREGGLLTTQPGGTVSSKTSAIMPLQEPTVSC